MVKISKKKFRAHMENDLLGAVCDSCSICGQTVATDETGRTDCIVCASQHLGNMGDITVQAGIEELLATRFSEEVYSEGDDSNSDYHDAPDPDVEGAAHDVSTCDKQTSIQILHGNLDGMRLCASEIVDQMEVASRSSSVKISQTRFPF